MTYLRVAIQAQGRSRSTEPPFKRLCLCGKAAAIAKTLIMNDCLGTLANSPTVARRVMGAAPVEVLDMRENA